MAGTAKNLGHGEKLSRKKEQAVAALMACGSQKQAAAEAGIGVRTLCRWLQDPTFQDAYTAAKRELLAGTLNKLRSVGSDAVDSLHAILSNRSSPATARVSAARGVVELLLRAAEIEDVTARLDRLEQAQARNGL